MYFKAPWIYLRSKLTRVVTLFEFFTDEQFLMLLITFSFFSSYGGSAERMSETELKQGQKWLNETFHLIR